MCLIQRTDPHLPAAPTGIEQNHLQPTAASLVEQTPAPALALPPSPLPGQTGLRYVISSAPSVLLLFFIFCRFYAVDSSGGSAGASRGVSEQPALAVTQGLNTALRTLFLRQGPLGAPPWGQTPSPQIIAFQEPSASLGLGAAFIFPLCLAGRRILGT